MRRAGILRAGVKFCPDCGLDLVGRGGCSKRCVPCQHIASRVRQRRYMRKYRATPEYREKMSARRAATPSKNPSKLMKPGTKSCVDCDTDLAGRGGHAKRCAPCSRSYDLQKERRYMRQWRAERADDPEYRDRIRRQWRAHYRSNDDYRERKRAAGRALHRDPDYKKRRNAIRRTRYASDPEFRAAKCADNRRRVLKRRQTTFRQLIAEQGGVCGICGHGITDGAPVHIDHIQPLSRGGRHDFDNLQAAHATCNIKARDSWKTKPSFGRAALYENLIRRNASVQTD